MAGKPPGSTARSSVSSRGSPSEENGPAVPPTASYSRGSSISGAPPPIPERSTPGPGSIGRHGSLSSVSSDLPEQPTERAPTLSSVGRRDSAGNFTKYFVQNKLFLNELNQISFPQPLKHQPVQRQVHHVNRHKVKRQWLKMLKIQ